MNNNEQNNPQPMPNTDNWQNNFQPPQQQARNMQNNSQAANNTEQYSNQIPNNVGAGVGNSNFNNQQNPQQSQQTSNAGLAQNSLQPQFEPVMDQKSNQDNIKNQSGNSGLVYNLVVFVLMIIIASITGFLGYTVGSAQNNDSTDDVTPIQDFGDEEDGPDEISQFNPDLDDDINQPSAIPADLPVDYSVELLDSISDTSYIINFNTSETASVEEPLADSNNEVITIQDDGFELTLTKPENIQTVSLATIDYQATDWLIGGSTLYMLQDLFLNEGLEGNYYANTELNTDECEFSGDALESPCIAPGLEFVLSDGSSVILEAVCTGSNTMACEEVLSTLSVTEMIADEMTIESEVVEEDGV